VRGEALLLDIELLTAWLHQQVNVAVVLAAAQQPDDVLVLPRLLDGDLLPHMLLLLLLQLLLMGLRDDLQQAGEARVNLKITIASGTCWLLTVPPAACKQRSDVGCCCLH
jgi:hypothetical protein